VAEEETVTDFEPEAPVIERLGPLTLQLWISEAFQEIVTVSPAWTRVLVVLIETCGTSTVTVAMFEFTEPPGPVQEI